MVQHIDFISKIPFLEDYTIDNKELLSIEPLSRINFLVGANNSGKSRFLRNLTKMLNNYQSPKVNVYSPAYDNAGISLLRINHQQVMTEISEILKKMEIISKDFSAHFLSNFVDGKIYNEFDLSDTLRELIGLSNPNAKHLKDFDEKERRALKNLADDYQLFVETILPIKSGQKLQVTYVPALRSLRKFERPKSKMARSIYGLPGSLKDFEKVSDPIFAIRSTLDYFYERDDRHSDQEVTRYDQTFRKLTLQHRFHLLQLFPIVG